MTFSIMQEALPRRANLLCRSRRAGIVSKDAWLLWWFEVLPKDLLFLVLRFIVPGRSTTDSNGKVIIVPIFPIRHECSADKFALPKKSGIPSPRGLYRQGPSVMHLMCGGQTERMTTIMYDWLNEVIHPLNMLYAIRRCFMHYELRAIVHDMTYIKKWRFLTIFETLRLRIDIAMTDLPYFTSNVGRWHITNRKYYTDQWMKLLRETSEEGFPVETRPPSLRIQHYYGRRSIQPWMAREFCEDATDHDLTFHEFDSTFTVLLHC